MTDKEIKNAIVRDIVGYEGLYTIDIFGNVTKVCNGKVMSQHKSNSGYMRVILSKKQKKNQLFCPSSCGRSVYPKSFE